MSRFQVRGTPAYFWVEDIEAPPNLAREPGRMCPSQLYSTLKEAIVLRNWLHERAINYPSLRQFEGGANWPSGDFSGYGATRSG